MRQVIHRSFLKWVGGKLRLVPRLKSQFCPRKKIFVEPFVGAGVIFLNTDYPKYYLSDINPDLIGLFKCIQRHPERFIEMSKPLFCSQNNHSERYYILREIFNNSQDPLERSVLFLYLNRHGYNGLCRYNASGSFNVPFGSHKYPYFPEKEIRYFAKKSKNATFFCESFEQSFRRAVRFKDALIYCDPPYASLATQTTQKSFTQYHRTAFSETCQRNLVRCAQRVSQSANQVVWISNHATAETIQWYCDAQSIQIFPVSRTISCQTNKRMPVKELLACYCR